MLIANHVLIATLAALGAAALAPTATAQGVFRIVGPDGRVSFSDKPPATTPAKAPATAGAIQPAPTGSAGALPFELRQVSAKYPVSLYTSADCAPCGAGKAFLTSRGVPFAEKTITSREDFDALQRLAGDTSLPLLTIGGQQIKGYSDGEWQQFLDAAGYPKAPLLPASYRNVAAAPLVIVQRAVVPAGDGQGAEPAAAGQRPPIAPRPAAPGPTGDNPAGIKF